MNDHSYSTPNSPETQVRTQLRKCVSCKVNKPLDDFYANGFTCKECMRRNSRARRSDKPGYLYLFRSSTGYYKIGVAEDVDIRHKQFHIPKVFEIEIICSFYVDDMFDIEQTLHANFQTKMVTREWFELSLDDVEYIKGLAK